MLSPMWQDRRWSYVLRDAEGGGSGTEGGGAPGDGGDSGAGDSGDGGRDDVAALKAALEEAHRLRKAAEGRAKKVEGELAKHHEANQSETEKAIAKAKTEGMTEALAKVNARVLSSEIRARAAGKLKNPALAPRLIDTDPLLEAMAATGEPDGDAIDKAIAKLLEDNPELSGKPPGPSTNGSDFRGQVGGPEPSNSKEWLAKALGGQSA